MNPSLSSLECDISAHALIANLPLLLKFIGEACCRAGAEASVGSALKLAVEEVCMNIITHGYAGTAPGQIAISFRSEPTQIVVVVSDSAKAFAAGDIPSPDLGTTWRTRREGGLGWHLIRQMVDQVEHESNPQRGNRLTLIKRIALASPLKE